MLLFDFFLKNQILSVYWHHLAYSFEVGTSFWVQRFFWKLFMSISIFNFFTNIVVILPLASSNNCLKFIIKFLSKILCFLTGFSWQFTPLTFNLLSFLWGYWQSLFRLILNSLFDFISHFFCFPLIEVHDFIAISGQLYSSVLIVFGTYIWAIFDLFRNQSLDTSWLL